jgi:hypothetical protein
MHDDAVEIVGPEGAALAAGLPVGTEHEVVDDQLMPALEQVRQGLSAARAFEDVWRLHALPGQVSALLAQLVAQAREILLFGQKLLSSLDPFVP